MDMYVVCEPLDMCTYLARRTVHIVCESGASTVNIVMYITTPHSHASEESRRLRRLPKSAFGNLLHCLRVFIINILECE